MSYRILMSPSFDQDNGHVIMGCRTIGSQTKCLAQMWFRLFVPAFLEADTFSVTQNFPRTKDNVPGGTSTVGS